jgi:hypothetical protein
MIGDFGSSGAGRWPGRREEHAPLARRPAETLHIGCHVQVRLTDTDLNEAPAGMRDSEPHC